MCIPLLNMKKHDYLKSDDYFITINGDNLSISFMYPNEMKLTGEINHIGFNN